MVGGSATHYGIGGTITATTGIVGDGGAFVNSENDVIELSHGTDDLGGSFAISAWYNLQRVFGNTERAFVFEGSDNFDISWGSGSGATANRFVAYVGQNPSGGTAEHNATNGMWHHVLHNFTTSGSNTTMQIFVDGTSLGTSTTATSNVDFTSINIGGHRNETGRNFDGLIDEVGLWSRSLSSEEIGQVYQSGLNGTAIPEPTTLATFSIACFGLAFMRRKK